MATNGNGGSGNETIFTMEATPLKYGRGASEEVGWEVKRLGVNRVMLISDPGVIEAGITPRIRELIEAEGIEVELWDRARVEPTADSFQEAADFAAEGDFDGFVAVGGGTSIDTAKVSDLIATHGGEIMDYVNPPIGGGKQPPSPLRPLLAVPTTSGTGRRGHDRWRSSISRTRG
jgi:alcohol dehydrogenase class IV